MNSVDKFFSAHKIIFVLFCIATLPLILAWCLIYGVLFGIIGITVDRFEYLVQIIYCDIIQTLKYPRWRAQKYEEARARSSRSEKAWENFKLELKEGKRKVPGKLGYAVQDFIVFGIILYPFLLIWGIIIGPVRAFSEYSKWWYKTWFGYSIYKGGSR